MNSKPTRETHNQPQLSFDPLAPTLFHQPWWLNAVSSGRYEQVEVSDGSRVVGRLPFVVNRLLGRTISWLPPLTHVLGPAVDEGIGSANTRFRRRYSVTKELIAKLPNFHRFQQKLHRGYPDALSFQSEAFRTSVQFTFEVAPQPEAEAWNGLRNKTRNVIRRAQEELSISEITDAEEFLHFYDVNSVARRRGVLAPRGIFSAVCSAALEKDAGKILAARDHRGALAAAVFLGFDTSAAYYLMSTRTSGSANGAVSLLIWEGMRLCINRDLLFDFDGIASEGAVLFYSGFGAQPRPIYIVTRDSRTMRFVDLVRGIKDRFAERDVNTFDRC